MPKRVLIAASRDWATTARLPSMLASVGLEVHLVASRGTAAATSRWLGGHTPVAGGAHEVALRALDLSPSFDRVVPCDETLLEALLGSTDDRAVALLPARPDALAAILDKTRFPAVAEAAGLRVPDWRVADGHEDVARVAEDWGEIVLKGRSGYGGRGVRAPRPGQEVEAAASLGFPLLVQRRVRGELALMPCLFDRGRLVAAFAARKRTLVRRFGPSSVNVLWAMDDELTSIAERAGAAFGLDGFASIDLFRTGDGAAPVVLEVNPRPVLQLHLGASVGVDMAAALRDVMSGDPPSEPRLSTAGGTVPLFPFELERLRRRHGVVSGTLRWAKKQGALRDVPWNDPALAWRQFRDS